MDIELNRQLLLLSEMSEVVHNYKDGKKIDFTRVNYEIEKLLHSAEICNMIIDNGTRFSNNEFYIMLNKFARLTDWNNYDCRQVINMAYHFKYDGYTTLTTSMQRVILTKEENEVEYFKEKVGVDLEVIYNKDFIVDTKHVYSVEEIQNLVNQKKIIIVREKERNIDDDKKYYNVEKYFSFDYAYDEYTMEYEFFNEGGKFFLYTLMYIRKELSSKKIKKLALEHLKNVKNEILDVITDGGFASDSWTDVAHKYAKEFEKQGYSKRLKKINDRAKLYN